MEYNLLQFFEFKVNMFLNNTIMLIFISLSILLFIGLLFYFDFKQNGDEFLSFKIKKLSRTDVFLLILPILFLSGLICVKNIVIQASPPQAVVESGKFKITKNVKILHVDKETGKAKVVVNGQKNNDNFIINIYNEGSEKNKSSLKYNSKSKIPHKGELITVKSPMYEWKFRNHYNFEYDDFAKKQFHILNSGKVNGYVLLPEK
ncbi:hypothetical protein [Fructilactobacillus frigidiflavus]|uniref:hypothetical protein n=1 Tax=Fructilactobacillus frigidiflavus TaxID=3242688 RepID=UPI00375764F2